MLKCLVKSFDQKHVIYFWRALTHSYHLGFPWGNPLPSLTPFGSYKEVKGGGIIFNWPDHMCVIYFKEGLGKSMRNMIKMRGNWSVLNSQNFIYILVFFYSYSFWYWYFHTSTG